MADFPTDTFRIDGTPSLIRASASQWSTFGVEASTAADQIRSLDTSLFIGPEGDTYSDGLTTDLPPQLAATGQAYSTVAEALTAFASTLSALQSRMAPLAVQAPSVWQAVQAAQGRVSSAQFADQYHARAQQQAPNALQQGQKLPPSTYQSDSGGASLALSSAQQAWDICLDSARQIKADLTAAVTSCADTIRDAAAMRFKKNPHGLGTLTSGFKHFVNDHAVGLAKLSGVLKTISAVAGVLSFVPVIGEIAAPIALATGATALTIDASIKYATGKGSWRSIAIDGALMALPGIGKLASKTVETAAGLTRFTRETNVTVAVRGGDAAVGSIVRRLNGAGVWTGRRLPVRSGPADGILVKRASSGEVTSYAEYDGASYTAKRVDLIGRSHADIPTPHTVDYVNDVNPAGEIFPRGLPVRAATPEEIPSHVVLF